MKSQMLKSVFIPILFISFSSLTNKNIENELQLNNDRIEIEFNRTLDFNDLVKIKLDLAERQININYKKIGFDKYGGLESLEFEVDCNDGFKGSATNTEIYNQTKFGFYRDYKKEAKKPFGIGNL